MEQRTAAYVSGTAAENRNRKKFYQAGDYEEEFGEYLRDIFSADGERNYEEYICIMAGKIRKSVPLREFLDADQRNDVLRRLWAEDLYYTPNTYCPTAKKEKAAKRWVRKDDGSGGTAWEKAEVTVTEQCNACDSNMFSMTVWGIDVDYKTYFESNQYGTAASPLDYYQHIMDTVGDQIPAPSWIETGHQLRMVYILAEPIARKSSKKAQAPLIKGLKKVQAKICGILNDELGCDAEPQRSWYRVPGSVNKKDGAVIRVEKVSGIRYTAQELIDEYLPDLPMAKDEYLRAKRRKAKGITVSKTGKVRYIHTVRTLHINRMRDYEVLASDPDVPREKLVFLYGVSWLQIHTDERDACMDALLAFNATLASPLQEKEIRSKCRRLADRSSETKGGAYWYKTVTIMRELGLTDEYCEEKGLHMRTDQKTARKQCMIAEGRTRIQRNQVRREYVKGLYMQGMTASEIAGVSEGRYSKRTIDSEVARIRADMTDAEKEEQRQARKARKHAAESTGGGIV